MVVGPGVLKPPNRILSSADEPAAPPKFLFVFMEAADEKVAAGIPAAFPKLFNVVPPDKNISPSVKTDDVGGGKENSSVTAV